jgi:hypothetical protein
MRPDHLLYVTWATYVASWFLPLWDAALPENLPGWEAFKFAFGVLQRRRIRANYVTSFETSMSLLGGMSNFLMLGSIVFLFTRDSGVALAYAGAAALAFGINAWWLTYASETDRELVDWKNWQPGYFLWWFSFLLLAMSALWIWTSA